MGDVMIAVMIVLLVVGIPVGGFLYTEFCPRNRRIKREWLAARKRMDDYERKLETRP